MTASDTTARDARPRRAMRGFTLVELLVTVALLTVTIFAVSSIFNISSDATSRTMAHTEVISASAAVQQQLTDQLSKIEPGLLIIESPAPTGVRADVPEGPQGFLEKTDTEPRSWRR